MDPFALAARLKIPAQLAYWRAARHFMVHAMWVWINGGRKGGRPLGVLLCFSIHGAGITGSISNFFYRLTSLEPSGNKNHRRPDVPSSWTNWFVHVCSFHHLWSILMIFDDFWSLGSGLLHFGPCPEGVSMAHGPPCSRLVAEVTWRQDG